MANVVTGNPFILDTAADDVVAGIVEITKIRWVGATAVDHTAQLEDAAERVIWAATTTDIGTATNVIVPEPESDFNPPLKVQGISVGALESGKLYVYHKSPNPVVV